LAAALLVFYQGFTQDFYQGEVWQLLTNTGPVARLVLLMLLGFSILSWAIIFRKFRVFRAAQHESLEFLKVFRQSKKLSEIRAFCRTLKESPLPGVFLSGYREIESQATMGENPGKPRIRSLEAVRRALQMGAFHGLATAGTASLHSVAPGIAEALITTAAGLFTAIPAVIAYNIFLQRIKEFGTQMDDFALEFLNMTERYFTD
jgi:biopolymer transport protein TolQ